MRPCTLNDFLLRHEWAALAMSASTIIVTLNALLLNRVRFREVTTQSLPP